MRKIFIAAIILLINGLIFSGCSKSSTTPTSKTTSGILNGYWLGTFTLTGGTTPTANEGELFKSDGTTVQYDFYGTTSTDTSTCQYKAYGNYTLTGDTVKFTITFSTLNETFNEIGVIDTLVQPNSMSGTFTSTTAPGGSLLFTKQ